jgi:hypothetical protein
MSRRRLIYRDAAGEREGTMLDDGTRFVVELCGLVLEADSPDSLSPIDQTPWPEPARLLLHHGQLCGAELEWERPIVLLDEADQPRQATLHNHLTLGLPAPNGGLDACDLRLALTLDDGSLLDSSPSCGDYEQAMLQIAAKLPDGWALRCCLGCGLSDYHPVGQGLIGSLMCFKDHADAYRDIWWHEHAKDALFGLLDAIPPPPLVHETHHCPRFERRPRGAGYRG